MNELEILIEDIAAFHKSCLQPVDGLYPELPDIQSNAECLHPIRLKSDGSEWLFDCKIDNTIFHLKTEIDLKNKTVSPLQYIGIEGLGDRSFMNLLISLSSRLDTHLMFKEYLPNDRVRHVVYKSGKPVQAANSKSYFDKLVADWQKTISSDVYEYFFGDKYCSLFGSNSNNLMVRTTFIEHNEDIIHYCDED